MSEFRKRKIKLLDLISKMAQSVVMSREDAEELFEDALIEPADAYTFFKHRIHLAYPDLGLRLAEHQADLGNLYLFESYDLYNKYSNLIPRLANSLLRKHPKLFFDTINTNGYNILGNYSPNQNDVEVIEEFAHQLLSGSENEIFRYLVDYQLYQYIPDEAKDAVRKSISNRQVSLPVIKKMYEYYPDVAREYLTRVKHTNLIRYIDTYRDVDETISRDAYDEFAILNPAQYFRGHFEGKYPKINNETWILAAEQFLDEDPVKMFEMGLAHRFREFFHLIPKVVLATVRENRNSFKIMETYISHRPSISSEALAQYKTVSNELGTVFEKNINFLQRPEHGKKFFKNDIFLDFPEIIPRIADAMFKILFKDRDLRKNLEYKYHEFYEELELYFNKISKFTQVSQTQEVLQAIMDVDPVLYFKLELQDKFPELEDNAIRNVINYHAKDVFTLNEEDRVIFKPYERSIVDSLARNTPSKFFSNTLSGGWNGTASNSSDEYQQNLNQLRDEQQSENPNLSLIESLQNITEIPENTIYKVYPEFIETALLAMTRLPGSYSIFDLIETQKLNISEEFKSKLFDMSIENARHVDDIEAIERAAKKTSSHEAISKFLEDYHEINMFVNTRIVDLYLNSHRSILEEKAKSFAERDPLKFIKNRLFEAFPDIKFGDIKLLRSVKDLDLAKRVFENSKNDVDIETPTNIKISKSIYQDAQRPESYVDIMRYEISQNNISPNKTLYEIGKQLIHAGDGVQHTNVGASGFTSAWALASFQPEVEEQKPVKDNLETINREKESLIIEQYQSDYPVVYHTVFLGNQISVDPDADGEKSVRKNWRALNQLIKDNAAPEKVREVFGYEVTDLNNIDPGGDGLFPIEIAPEVEDARKHFDLISKVYPYLVIINCIEISKKTKSDYVYLLKNAAYYANIANKKKAKYLYEDIPKLIAVDQELTESGNLVMAGEPVWRLPATDESVKILRDEIKKLTGKDESYDFALTPAQNIQKAKQIAEDNKEKKKTWNASPDNVKKLQEILKSIKDKLPETVMPDIHSPREALKFLNEDVAGKLVPRKQFNSNFSDINKNLSILSRAWQRDQRLRKIAIIRYLAGN